MKIVTYHSSIALKKGKSLKNRKYEVLLNFHKGVDATGLDQAVLTEEPKIQLDADVHVVLGYVYDSMNSPHIKLKKEIIREIGKNKNKHAIFIDSSLFNYRDKTSKYLRYSIDGVFPETGDYLNDVPTPQKWEMISKDLGFGLKKWREWDESKYILICLQRSAGWSFKGNKAEEWAIRKIEEIRKHSNRPILVRPHPGKPGNINDMRRMFGKFDNVRLSGNGPLTQDLEHAHCSVHFNSAASTASVIEGIPIFIEDESCQARDMAFRDIDKINDNMKLPNRNEWIRKIAQSHWSDNELLSGNYWRTAREKIIQINT
jgi:hypothetical protein